MKKIYWRSWFDEAGDGISLLASFPFFSQDLPTGHRAGNLAIGLKCGLT